MLRVVEHVACDVEGGGAVVTCDVEGGGACCLSHFVHRPALVCAHVSLLYITDEKGLRLVIHKQELDTVPRHNLFAILAPNIQTLI